MACLAADLVEEDGAVAAASVAVAAVAVASAVVAVGRVGNSAVGEGRGRISAVAAGGRGPGLGGAGSDPIFGALAPHAPNSARAPIPSPPFVIQTGAGPSRPQLG